MRLSIFAFVYWPSLYLSWWSLFSDFKVGCFSSYYQVVRVLHKLWIQFLCQIHILWIFYWSLCFFFHLLNGIFWRGFPGGSDGKVSACNAGDLGLIPGSEDPLEKEMAIHSSTLVWKIPWMEEPDRLQSMGLQKVRHDWATSLSGKADGWFKSWHHDGQGDTAITAGRVEMALGPSQSRVFYW